MSGHTPAPWKALPTPNDADFTHEIFGAGFAIASVYAANERSEANARLIAAAPELLAALIKARDEIGGLPHSLGYDFTHLPMIDAAIAKATQP